MRKDNVLLTKTYSFSLRIVRLYLTLIVEHHEYVLSKQLLRSGTSIGANSEEAIGAQSRKDFKSKLSIAYKEARESHYWLRLMKDTKIIKYELGESLIIDCEELLKIIGSILKTLKQT